MQLYELQQAIKVKFEVPKFLIFYGSEYVIIDLYIKQIAKQLSLNPQNISSVNQVVKPHQVINLLGSKNLYVCRYDFDFQKQEKLWNGIDNKLGTNYLVLVLPTLDKRSKFSKYFEKRAVEFAEQGNETIKTMLKGKTNLSATNLERLIKGCRGNYSVMLLEIDKIKTLAKVRNISEDESYLSLLNDGTIKEAQDTKLQEFIDSVMRKSENAFKLYRNLRENKEPNLSIIAWLYNAVRNQLSVQTVSYPSQENTGLNYYFIQECKARLGYYTIKELLNFLKIIKYCEQGIKNGAIDEEQCVEYIMVNAL